MMGKSETKTKRCLSGILFMWAIALGSTLHANRILIPMDESQKNHLKAYGVAYWLLEKKTS
jgi:hypothetical protein